MEPAYRRRVAENADFSLMDDREFLEELDHLEPVQAPSESAHVRERTLAELEDGLPITCTEIPHPIAHVRHDDEEPPRLAPPAITELPATDAPAIDRDPILWMGGGFVIGAASAVLIFHDRVADILALLR